MIPILSLAIPTLIHLAESIFAPSTPEEKTGAAKKAWVMDFVGKLFDNFVEKGEIPKWVPRDLIIEAISLLIDHLVPQLTK